MDDEILRFNSAVIEALVLIRQDLEKSDLEQIQLPQDWPSTQAILRTVAEDLMLCSSSEKAITLLRQDRRAALTVVTAAMTLKPAESRKAVKLAHARTPSDFSTLPFLPLASYLIVLCDNLEGPEPVK